MVSRLAPFQHAFVKRLSELGVAYSGSPIVEGAGERYFGDSLRGGEGIRSRFLLLLASDLKAETKAAAQRISESFGDVLEIRSHPGQGLTLIRPDGYVAYADRESDAASLNSMKSVLERQTMRKGGQAA